MDYLKELNSAQKAAVEYGDGPILILAGAGSGKTRVLTYRIAHLVLAKSVDPTEILAVTFTNKAAQEMKHRLFSVFRKYLSVPIYEHEMWISTFHSACVRILRSELGATGYPTPFTVYDDSDQHALVKACLKELNISDTKISPRMIQSRINKIKNDGYSVENYPAYSQGPLEDIFHKVFERYSESLKFSAALDFGDLILKTVEIFQKFPVVLKKYQERFRYLFIDEYQDTNRCQYLLMKLLAGENHNVCVVGDEDQSIYRWRGANISNILNFETDFPNAQVFKLEENYRSSRNIIEAASHVVSHNTERRDKTLWTQNESGELIKVFEAYDDHDEAIKVVNRVEKLMQDGLSIGQMAVFYRTNAQSRLLEDALRTKGLNYQIYGGLKFYERLEVKDSLSYLKLIANPRDDVSFRRIINVPARGVGEKSLEKILALSQQYNISHYEVLERIFGDSPTLLVDLGKSKKNFQAFFHLMESLKKEAAELLPSHLLDQVLNESGYREALQRENTFESQNRLENLQELKKSIIEHELRFGAEFPNQIPSLTGFLEEIALVSGTDTFDAEAPAIKLMTIHMAKGLEFDVVYIVGLEEELFPNVNMLELESEQEIEEERRLFYVAMTRARQRLFLFYAKNRTIFGRSSFRVPSRFLKEIPQEFLEVEKADFFSRRRDALEIEKLPGGKNKVDYDEFNQAMDGFDEFTQVNEDRKLIGRGSVVAHPTYGEGKVVEVIGQDKVIVLFQGYGLKKLSKKLSNLTLVSC